MGSATAGRGMRMREKEADAAECVGSEGGGARYDPNGWKSLMSDAASRAALNSSSASSASHESTREEAWIGVCAL